MRATSSPVIGERTGRVPLRQLESGTPRARRSCVTSSATGLGAPRVSFVAMLTLLASHLVRRAHSTGDGAKSIAAFDGGGTAGGLDSNPNYLPQRCPIR